MKEKTYYEVIGKMEEKSYDEIESQLSLGETCVELIKRIEGRKDVIGASKLITVNGKKIRRNYQGVGKKARKWNT